MKSSKSTKRALLASVFSMALCLSMLIGTTFAWFTDTASTAVNTIRSGKLDVGLQMLTQDANEANPTWKNAENKILNFKAADDRTDILWEPGCTYELPQLRVVNYGNLALKYEIRITGMQGDAKLLEALEFSVNDAAFNNANGTYIGNLAAGSATNPTASDALTISGHMKETAGNEYQGLSIDGIAITVYATQDTVENDSFDNTYDENAFDALAELYPISTTVSVSKTGDTTIDKDTVKMTIPAAAIADDATSITVSVNKSADADARFGVAAEGKKIQQFDVKVTGLKTDNTTPVTVKMFIGKGYDFTDVEVKHLNGNTVETLSGTYDTATGFVTFTTTSFSPFAVEVPDMPVVSGEGLNTCFYADLGTAFEKVQSGDTVTLLRDVTADEKAEVPKNKEVTLNLNGKTFTTGAQTGIAVKGGAALTVQNGTIKSTTEMAYSYAIKIEAKGSLIVNSGKVVVTNTNCTCVSNNGTLTINGGEIDARNGKYWLNVSTTGKTTYITGGTFIGNANIKDGQTAFSITGGTFSTDLSDYCADGYTMIKNDDGMYVCGKGAPEGYTEDSAGNVTISGAAALRYVANRVNNYGSTYAGRTVTLANDINLSGENWVPIGYYDGNNSRQFKGTFDGAGHKITNMTVVSGSRKGVGFFGKADSATVKNLTVEGTITADMASYVGGIIGHGSGTTVENCTFNGTINGACTQVGGIVGSGSFTVTSCQVNGTVSGSTWVGGIVGNLQAGSGAYTNCTVTGTVKSTLGASDSNIFAGGIAAAVREASQVITGCYCDAKVIANGEEVNRPIIDSYNGAGITAETRLHIDNNSWNLEKNSNTSYTVRDSGVEISGRTVARVELTK